MAQDYFSDDELYRRLREHAERAMQGERAITLGVTALVNEYLLRQLKSGRPLSAESLHHCSKIMRQVVIEHARRSKKRIQLDSAGRDELSEGGSPDVDVVWLRERLEQLERDNAPVSRVILLRYFAGLPFQKIADIEGSSLATVKRYHNLGMSWLRGGTQ